MSNKEPEVVAEYQVLTDPRGKTSGICYARKSAYELGAGSHELITLQAHREAIAKKEAEFRSLSMTEIAAMNPGAMEWVKHWEDRALKAESAIAKKDAALKACVEARKKLNAACIMFQAAYAQSNESERAKAIAAFADAEAELDAAITQAKEQLK